VTNDANQPGVGDLLQGLGLLVVTFGRVEIALVLLANAPRLDEAPAHLAKWAADRLARDVHDLARNACFGEASEEISQLVVQLRGNGGLIQRRNRYIHVFWKPTEDGGLRRHDLRRLLLENHPDAIAAFDAEDLAELIVAVGTVGDRLYELVGAVWPARDGGDD